VEAGGPGLLLLEGRRMAVEGPMAEALAHWQAHRPRTGGQGERLTGGLRPEHLRLAPAANRNLTAEVSHCEALGNEQLLTCRLLEGSHLVLVRTGPEESITPGQTVHLEVDPEGWRLFDGQGNALSPPAPKGSAGELRLPNLPAPEPRP
jgi:multiple sugar transport system ATP-binding protein